MGHSFKRRGVGAGAQQNHVRIFEDIKIPAQTGANSCYRVFRHINMVIPAIFLFQWRKPKIYGEIFVCGAHWFFKGPGQKQPRIRALDQLWTVCNALHWYSFLKIPRGGGLLTGQMYAGVVNSWLTAGVLSKGYFIRLCGRSRRAADSFFRFGGR